MPPKLHAVAPPQEAPLDITLALRADIAPRDWAAVHIAADRRAPLMLGERPKRLWRA